MIDYLIEREQEENLRTSVRTLTFPDGETRRVEAYRIIWTWFDRAIAFEFGPSEDEILTTTLDCAEEESLPLGQALGRVLNFYVSSGELGGFDYTDHNLPLVLSKDAVQRFHERKDRSDHYKQEDC